MSGEVVAEVVFGAWELAVEWATERYGRAAGFVLFVLPLVMIALVIWLIILAVN